MKYICECYIAALFLLACTGIGYSHSHVAADSQAVYTLSANQQ